MTIKRFTLIEVLLALFVTSVLFAGIALTFHRSLVLREQANVRSARSTRLRIAEESIYQALGNAMIPSGTLANSFVGEMEEDGDNRLDSLEFAALSHGFDSRSIGDVIRVEFAVEENEENGTMELIRRTYRNLLAFEEEEPEEIVLLKSVESFEATYHDGTDWVDSWDSAIQEDALPKAVKIIVKTTDDESETVDQMELFTAFAIETPKSSDGGGGK